MTDVPVYLMFIASFLSISMIAMGVIAVVKNFKSLTNRLFCLFSITLAFWNIASFLENFFYNFKVSLFFLNLDFFLGIFVFFFAFLFLFNFPQENKKINKYVLLFFIPVIINVYLLMNGGIISNIEPFGGKVIFKLGAWFWFYVLVGILSVSSSVVFQFIQYKKSFGIKKEQIKYILFGTIVYSGVILVFNFFLQNMVSGNVIMMANFSSVILVFCIFYAIIRYRLMDIKIILRLGIAFTFLLSIIIAVYMLADYFLMGWLKINGFLAYIIPSVLITTTFIPLKRYLGKVTNDVFFNGQYEFAELVREIERNIHRARLDLDQTLENVNRILTNALHAKRGAILILNTEGNFVTRQAIGHDAADLRLRPASPIVNYLNAYHDKILIKEDIEGERDAGEVSKTAANAIIKDMDKKGFSLAVPIKFEDKLIGVYLFGEKKSHDTFTREDLALLQHVCWEISFAVENSRSYEELQRLDAAKSNFISVASHQLRTPVTISRCNLELCFDSKIKAKEKTFAITTAYDSVVFLGRQLDQLLTVLDIEEHGAFAMKQKNKIADIINEVLEANELGVKNKKLKLELDIDKKIKEINCDRAKIKNILNIVIINAISYSFVGGSISLAVKKREFNNKAQVIFSVSDNGIGVSEESKPEMFKKFFRGQEAISMLPNGLGLGLYISKKLISVHGGDIWFENKDHGVTFYFSLPL
ncbi:MAG: ATP-binding protein [Candidatus Falkowbacteria bacterium]